MRSETQPYSTVLQSVIAIRLCRTAHAIFFPKFWNDKMNFTRVFVTISPRRPWDRGWATSCFSLPVQLYINVHFLPINFWTPEQASCCHIKSILMFLNFSAFFYLKPFLHDQIFFDKFHMSNAFWPCKSGFFDKFAKNFSFKRSKYIWHMKFVRENLVV